MRIKFRLKTPSGLIGKIGETSVLLSRLACGFSREWVVGVLSQRFGDLPCLTKSGCYTPRLGKSSGLR